MSENEVKTQYISWTNQFRELPERFFARALPTPPSNPTLIRWNEELAQFLNFKIPESDKEFIVEVFSGAKIPSGAEPLAQAYAGHQFAHFVPQLGDGRAILLGEVVAKDGRSYDVQLKGAGATFFSRRGDGKSALGPVLREYLVSEYMHRCGVPSTRALCAILTGDDVQRLSLVPGAVMTRVAESHLRVGTFEYFFYRNDWEALEILLHVAVNRHAPHLLSSKNLALSFLKWVIERQADLVSSWMALGFVHGVMNTDNFSVGGITLDYGPCAFLEEYARLKVFSSIDRTGRYAYANQAPIAQWNLLQLATTLKPLIDKITSQSDQEIADALTCFPALYEEKYLEKMLRKIGIVEVHGSQNAANARSHRELLNVWLGYLESENLDFTLSHRELAKEISGASSSLPRSQVFENFMRDLLALIPMPTRSAVSMKMNEVNPWLIPRNHQIERAIELANLGDFSHFHKICEALCEPFKELNENAWLAVAAKQDERVLKTFCGT